MSDVGAVLQRIRGTRPRDLPRPGERCEFCDEVIPDEHAHVVDLQARALKCACHACHFVFSPDGAGGSRFRAVPDRYLRLDDDRGAWWSQLDIPVGLAFFLLDSSNDELTVFYPGPAGATESLLPVDAWASFVAARPDLAVLRPDVEALLVRGSSSTEPSGGAPGEIECFIVPVDVCYELVGELRRVWRGFDGGGEAREAIERFFERVRAHAAGALG